MTEMGVHIGKKEIVINVEIIEETEGEKIAEGVASTVAAGRL